MAITRLKRKARKNKLRSKLRLQKISLESAQPVIKNVDIEALKEEFKAKPAKAEKVVKDTPKAEAVVETPAKEEKKAATKKAVAKKEEAPKAEKVPAKKAAPKKEE